MAKFKGKIGYISTCETKPGVWKPIKEERPCRGDFVRNTIQFQTSDSTNDDVDVSNEISIVADPFARENFKFIRYIVYKGNKWKVTKVDVRYPRLILSIGGVYNG